MSVHILKFALIGDVVGQPGQALFKKHAPLLRTAHKLDGLIVNGENSASNGRGISPAIAEFFLEHGADVITSGNHIWHNKEIYSYLDSHKQLLRPNNFPSSSPGRGVAFFECANGQRVGVLNLQGRVFMREFVDCPFRSADTALLYLRSQTPIIFVDFHAETTSEKMAMGFYLDGRVSGLVGTHTHIQTADHRVLPKGTAYVTDLGMGGSLNSMIGMQKDPIIQNFITQMPQKFMVDHLPPFVLSGVIISVESSTGRAVSIEPIRIIDNNLDI